MFLIDTSVWIFALRRRPIASIRDRVDQLLAQGQVATTGIVRLELLGGVRTDEERERLGSRLDALTYFATERRLWDEAAGLLLALKRTGVTIPPTDALIASCAIGNDAVLVHADAHFDLVARHAPLEIESMITLLG